MPTARLQTLGSPLPWPSGSDDDRSGAEGRDPVPRPSWVLWMMVVCQPLLTTQHGGSSMSATSPRLPPWAPADNPIPQWCGSIATATPWCSRSPLTSRRHGTWRATLGSRCPYSTSTTPITLWRSGERLSWSKIPENRCQSDCRRNTSASRRRPSQHISCVSSPGLPRTRSMSSPLEPIRSASSRPCASTPSHSR
jgi:hypothetical protein